MYYKITTLQYIMWDGCHIDYLPHGFVELYNLHWLSKVFDTNNCTKQENQLKK